MSNLDDAIRSAADDIVGEHIDSLCNWEEHISEQISNHLRPLFDQQQEIIKHQFDDQAQLENQLEQLVGSTAQGDSHGMESIYDVVERRWKEQQAEIDRLKVMLAKSVDIAASIQCWTKDEASHSYEDDSQYSHGWSDCRCAIENELNKLYHQSDTYTEWARSFHNQCSLKLKESESEIERLTRKLREIRDTLDKWDHGYSAIDVCERIKKTLGDEML